MQVCVLPWLPGCHWGVPWVTATPFSQSITFYTVISPFKIWRSFGWSVGPLAELTGGLMRISCRQNSLQTRASFVTWCPCYVGGCAIHYPLLWMHILGSFHQVGASFVTCVLVTWVDVPFIILIMSAHSWVIPPGWGQALWHGVLVT